MKRIGVAWRGVLCLAGLWALAGPVGAAGTAGGQAPPARIDSVVMLPKQPHASDPKTIWYDDFDGPAKAYTEAQGGLDGETAFGGAGKSMLCLYEKGARGVGNRKVFFGDSPTGRPVRKGQRFDEVYWRIYVRHQLGWTGGGPAKMSRAISFASDKWNEAMIAHVWSSGEALTLDPASGVRDGRVVTTVYNDFPNLHWLGNRPASAMKISSTEESGWWVCVESRAKLNAPGKKDGLNQLWIDGRLAAERRDLDWRGTYADHGINAVFLEAYWNDGSPVTQRRWYDNFVISEGPIGPVVCPGNPTLIRSAGAPGAAQAGWEVEVARYAPGGPASGPVARTDADENLPAVWRSQRLAGGDRVMVNASAGEFVGALAGQGRLAPGKTYLTRIREQAPGGDWSAWSRWHQAFAVGE